MASSTTISETKVLWDRTANKLYVWDEGTKAWALFFVAANCVTNDQLTTALALKLNAAGGTVSGNLTVSGRLALGGAAIDPNNVLVLQGANSLFTNPSGSFGFVFSKAAAANDASLTFQDNYSTRALVGLLGNDDLTFKVTPDGATWYTGFTVDRNTGKVDHTQGAKFEALTNFDNYIASNTWTKVQFNSTNHNDQSAFNASSNRFVAPIAGYYTIGFRLRFKANSTVPASLQGKFYKNGSALAYAAAESWGTVVTMKTSVAYQTTMKLAANDYIEVYTYMETNDGYIDQIESVFQGARIA